MKKKKRSSLRFRVFSFIIISTAALIFSLIIVNTVFYKNFYIDVREDKLQELYYEINNLYNEKDLHENQVLRSSENADYDIILELERLSKTHNVDIVIKTDEDLLIYTSNERDHIPNMIVSNPVQSVIAEWLDNIDKSEEKAKGFEMFEGSDVETEVEYINLTATLDNGNELILRMTIPSIEENVEITNMFLGIIGAVMVVIIALISLITSKKIVQPIKELEMVAKKMTELDFTHKYSETSSENELNQLGISINKLSEQLEKTINQLQETNIELEKDIEEKSRIDEMRTQFISDVSHELKTPISLIQGYAEGLKEGIDCNDVENRDYYINVILDEATKMDTLVKQLLELMKLEYQTRDFNDVEFNIVELIKEVIRKSRVLIDKDVEVILNAEKPINIFADPFYVEQVITNYFTNAIKHVEKVNEKKSIIIDINENYVYSNEDEKAQKALMIYGNRIEAKTRISIFNTGKNIPDEDKNKIWNRFYKRDASRNREDGGTGIGLAFVKAIMNNYNSSYGYKNKENGVEFYIEL